MRDCLQASTISPYLEYSMHILLVYSISPQIHFYILRIIQDKYEALYRELKPNYAHVYQLLEC